MRRCAAMGDLATVQATDVVPGLTLIAPADGASFVPGIYRIGVQDRRGERTYTLCVGPGRDGRRMSFEDGHGPAEFRPVKLGPRRRRLDPLAVGVVLVIARAGAGRREALGLAGAGGRRGPSVAPSVVTSAPVAPSESPGERGRPAGPAHVVRRRAGRDPPPGLGDPDHRRRRRPRPRTAARSRSPTATPSTGPKP